MARTFTSSTSNYLSTGSVITTYPLTMACWCTLTATGTNRGIMFASTAINSVTHMFGLSLNTTERLQFQCSDASGLISATSAVAVPSDGSWFHACGVGVSATDRSVYVNGGSLGTAVQNRSPAGIAMMAIGRRSTLTYAGDIAWACVWNEALSAGEVLTLSRRVCPLRVRPQSLVACWPLFGRNSPEIDIIGKFDHTINGTLNQATQPNVLSWMS